MAVCDLCASKAVWRDPASGAVLCGDHFSAWYEEGVRDAIEKYAMIPSGSRVAVGLSGGKDSTVLLTVLAKLNLDAEFVAITVDEGIANYRDDTISAAVSLVKRLGVEHRIVSFADVCGKTLDELLVSAPERACSVCGTLRRRALNAAARDAGASLIATGHCMDDEAQSVLMNYLRGDIRRVAENYHTNAGDLFIPRIKPLCRCTERATVAYGIVNRLLTPLPECPYTKYALRAGIRTELGVLEHKYPGTLSNIVSGQERLIAKLGVMQGEVTEMGVCERCGEPTQNRLCAACTLIEKLEHLE
ncbi:TIGR00269 family protein [Methanorbis rubei]|uniref:tRNA-5-methyluridine(54) 2-sulfurtransferase n=1 Tax=Methanorbis rubei TaxID=3028300 RepID=A0AAE4MFZ4_9EURY|nr:tRNA-5-methyluridine(54) 2-sulfurtransferase [Methanocorpusculaceae archaeon Cs1]